MKQYTSKDQTAKLIELGFPKPNHSSSVEEFEGEGWAGYVRVTFNYSVGELICLLPRWIKLRGGLEIVAESNGWLVMHGHDPFDPQCTKTELIDALFEYCVTLKEEGVI
jgi:hypothetical protein